MIRTTMPIDSEIASAIHERSRVRVACHVSNHSSSGTSKHDAL